MPLPSNPFGGHDDLSMGYLNADPTAGWGAYTGKFGLGGDPFSDWLRNQQSRHYTQYSGQQAWNPSLTWTDYLKTIDPTKEFAGMDRYSRGINPRAWTGRTRWSM